jgi:hypothetical protein
VAYYVRMPDNKSVLYQQNSGFSQKKWDSTTIENAT